MVVSFDSGGKANYKKFMNEISINKKELKPIRKRRGFFLLLFALIFMWVAVLEMAFAMPVFLEMFGGAAVYDNVYPYYPLVEFLYDCSKGLMQFHGLVLLLVIGILSFGMIYGFRLLSARESFRALSITFWTIILFLVILIVLITGSLFLPLFSYPCIRM